MQAHSCTCHEHVHRQPSPHFPICQVKGEDAVEYASDASDMEMDDETDDADAEEEEGDDDDN